MDRRSKIVATIGPASQSVQVLEKLMQAGMNVARLNFSHGTHEDHAERIGNVRKVADGLSRPVAILQDLQGPKIRAGRLAAPLELAEGEKVCLYPEEDAVPGNCKCFPVDFPELFTSVKDGDKILMDDGHLSLLVEQVSGRKITASVLVGGKLLSNKGINLPGVSLSIPGFTEKDREDLVFGMKHHVDMVAISFVRSADDLRMVRRAMDEIDEDGPRPLLIAKLERPEALDNLEGILDVADGVMVARGDLGVEMSPERVPVAQKRIIREADLHGKIVITATQMLESMISNPLPTRAEASDVANAIFDGTDAIMLSAETASGNYPVESVSMMDRIAQEAERDFFSWGHYSHPETRTHDDAESIARAARELAHDLNVAAVAVFTNSGRTAQMMSKVRPRVPIYAFTPIEQTYHRMAMLWGVSPQLLPMSQTLRDMVNNADAVLTRNAWVKPGQQVVVICGFPVQTMRRPNMALLHTVGEMM